MIVLCSTWRSCVLNQLDGNCCCVTRDRIIVYYEETCLARDGPEAGEDVAPERNLLFEQTPQICVFTLRRSKVVSPCVFVVVYFTRFVDFEPEN